jgi:hypothetical protein
MDGAAVRGSRIVSREQVVMQDARPVGFEAGFDRVDGAVPKRVAADCDRVDCGRVDMRESSRGRLVTRAVVRAARAVACKLRRAACGRIARELYSAGMSWSFDQRRGHRPRSAHRPRYAARRAIGT